MDNHRSGKDLVKRTAKLEKELSAKTHELEIEAALEKVRTVAMRMNKPGDVPDVCKTLFKQFSLLGFSEMRNAMVNIHNDADKSFINYDYSDEIGKSTNHLTYNIHPLVEKQIKKIRSANDAFSETYFSGKDLVEWRKFRKRIGEKNDPRLRKTKGLYYYFYSLGTGSIGISTFGPISKEKKALLKRFRNVFNLSYRRYIDIAKAEAQAREAQIEAALERMRASAMAMHNSDGLYDTAEIVYKELFKLGIESSSSGFGLVDDKAKRVSYYGINPVDGKIARYANQVPTTETKVMGSFRSAWKNQEASHVIELNKQETLEHETYVAKCALASFKEYGIEAPFTIEGWLANSPKEVKLHFFNFRQGCLYIIRDKKLTDVQEEMMVRFTKVFQLTYTRFLDLQKAEAQAREAQIQLALERVRARTMAMQKSDELPETAAILFDQFKSLGQELMQMTIGIVNEADGVIEFSVTDWSGSGAGVHRAFNLSIEEPSLIKKMYTGWKENKRSIVVDLTGKELENWISYRNKMSGVTVNSSDTGGRRVITSAFFSKGHLSVSTPVLPVIESIQLLERFAQVFDLTYTRFLDLQKAETQARESQIQLALERVRARTMAMQKSDELMEASNLLFQQVQSLGIPVWSCGYNIWEKGEKVSTAWMSVQGGIQPSFRLPLTEHRTFMHMYESRLKGEPFYVEEVSGEELADHYRYMFSLPDFREIVTKQLPDGLLDGFPLPQSQTHNVFNFKHGNLVFLSAEAVPEAWDIFKRFTAVFEQTYTRFLDLQKAEAQVRESEIELALERVRAKTMAMQKPGEFGDVINVIGEQFAHLAFDIEWVNFGANGLDISNGIDIWNFAVIPGLYRSAERVFIPYFDHPVFTLGINQFEKFRNAREDFYEILLDKKDKDSWLDHLFTKTIYKDVSDELKTIQYPKPGYVSSNITLKDTWLSIGKYGSRPFTDEQNAILRRFANAFGQAYTRFLDLQKAEAQARQAQIEASLERVRASAMAMHRSDELSNVLAILFEQFDVLKIQPVDVHLDLFDLEKNTFSYRATGKEGKRVIAEQIVDLGSRPEWQALLQKWKKGKPNTVDFSYYPKKVIRELMAFFPDIWAAMPEDAIMSPEDFPDGIFDALGFCKFGYIGFHHYRKATEEEQKILIRFANEFERLYQRFLDLQKAEAQARESQIQLALERVRARTMAMQRSDELAEAAALLFKQVSDLGIKAWSTAFQIWNVDDISTTAWPSAPDGSMQTPFRLPYDEDNFFKQIYKARQRGEDFFVMESSGKELEATYKYMFNLPDVKKFFEDAEHSGFSIPTFQITHCAFFSHGYLMFITYEHVPEMWDIFKRFAKVFEQTYTRFLDLQKAEAQVREAQIELGLERVRARAMAMQKSDELSELVDTVFKELTKLDFALTWCIINIIDEPSMSNMVWAANPDIDKAPDSYHMKFEDYPFHHAMMKGWKERKTKYVYVLEGTEKKIYDKYLFNETEFRKVPEAAQAASSAMEKYVVSFSFSNFGGLQTVGDVPLSDANLDILSRFGKVFDLTYTRFNDLKQAEAQAREAQIEAALERVRSRTMAMQRSEELANVATVLFQQVKALGVPQWTCGFSIFEIDDKEFTWYPGSAEGDILLPVKIPLTEHPVFISFNESRKRGDELYVYEKTGEMQADHYLYMLSLPVVGEGLQNMLDSGIQFPSFQIDHLANFSHGNLVFITYEHFPEMHDVFRRFAKVFDQTYTRFLDLQKAEAQAREAQIEAALERVRSRSMGMQKSEELKEVIQVVYEQFVHLNMNVEHTGFVMDYKARDDYDIWIADQLAVPSHVTIPYFDSVYYNRFNEAKKKGEDFFATNLDFEEKNRFYKKIIEYVPGLPEETKEFLFSIPGLAASTVLLDNVCLYIENFSGIPYSDEENNTLMRFGKVFQQTYTRFLDLQKAEAQGREAIKRASVDRVRAEIASMRTTNDLERITPLIWNELTTLGVPFVRCGVFIMDEEKQLVETHLSTPDGRAIASFTSTFSGTQLLTEILPYWQRRQIYKAHWDEARFLEQAKSLVQQGSITSGEKYLTENRPTDLYLHFLPFLQGMLYAGNTTPLSDDELQLMQNLADAFSTAYARYEDFNKLEVAKEQIEKTLVDLKQAQQQLVQSEKMASLGELTAGIAHEIQNPLNFVNNFSDVNKELLEELKEEADKGNIAEIKAIANDVINNEAKINHHGKRADAIVKNMLQHSRSSGATKELTDINKLADEYLRLSYHGLRAKDKSFNADFKTDLDNGVGKLNIIPQDFGRVLLNLFNNAFYATNEKSKQHVEGYEPTISVSTKKINGKVEIIVKDNGNGMPQKVVDKIFQPFFTTKPTGQGTGLGLSLSYDIVKAHNGEIKVETKEGEGSEFVIQLPV